MAASLVEGSGLTYGLYALLLQAAPEYTRQIGQPAGHYGEGLAGYQVSGG